MATLPIKIWCLAIPLFTCVGTFDARAGQKEFTGGGSSSLSTGTYSPSGAPGSTDNVVIDSGSPTGGTYTITGGSTLNIQDLSFSLGTTTSIANDTTSTSATTLELNGGRGNTIPLLDENTTKNLTIKNGSTGSLNLLLGASGSFRIDNTGNLTVSSNIGEVNSGTTLTIAAGASGTGTVTLSGTNSFSGGLVAAGGEVDVTGDASLGATGGSITINGGRLAFATNPTTIGTARSLFLGANPTGGNTTGTLSIKGTITVTYGGVIQNLSGSTGDLVKQGGGTLVLGGVSTYTGNTFLNNGITQLTTGNNRLPTGTTVALGQTASPNVGTLDLNGFNQQIAGLNSTNATTSTPTTKNTVTTSTGSSTLTLGGSGTYTYGDGSAMNSGVITGAIAVLKSGTGTQTLGDVNTYSGGTAVTGGSLLVTNTSGSAIGTGAIMVNNSGTLFGGTGMVSGTVSVSNLGQGGTISAGITTQTAKTTLTTGALTLGTSSTFNAIIAGNTAYGTLSASGTTNVSAAAFSITVPTGTTLTNGETLTLITSPVTGQFTDTTFTTGGYSFKADYGNGEFSVDVGVVPEPATVLGGVLMIGALGWSQRRRFGGWMTFGLAR